MIVDKKMIAIAAACVIVIAGIAAVALASNQGERGGWYAWGPEVGEVDYSSISMTPGIIDVIEDMYGTVYGKLPAKGDGKLSYDPLVERTATGIEVTSYIGKGSDMYFEKVGFTDAELSKTKIISYGSGFTDCVYDLYGDKVWEKVVAAGNSTYKNYPDNKMVNWSQVDDGNLGSEYNLSTENIVSFLKYVDAPAQDSTYVLVLWGYAHYVAEVRTVLSGLGYDNVKMVCVDYYSMTSLEGVLAVMDMIGQITGVDTDDNDSVNDFQSRLSGITGALADTPADGRTVYLEKGDGGSPGPDTLANACFDVLKLKNIKETNGTNKLSDEIVVLSEPDYIFFVDGDDRTMDQKMRVTV